MSFFAQTQHPNRESWLSDVADRLRPAFARLGAPLPERLRIAAYSGDRERLIRLIMNTDSGDREHPFAVAYGASDERPAGVASRYH